MAFVVVLGASRGGEVEAGTQSGVLRLAQPTLSTPVRSEPKRETLALGLLEPLMMGQSQMMGLKVMHGSSPVQ